jgi:methylenetetrahydrofolate dehydrogenase (NADP+)/methenyltetrahydrofolate cyclohydrolase
MPDEVRDLGRLDGQRMAATIRAEIRMAADRLEASRHRRPGLAVIVDKNHAPSRSYVRGKERAAADVGFHTSTFHLPPGVRTEDVLAEVNRLNQEPAVDGILVQLPLPAQVDANAVLGAVAPRKDVDGLTPASLGRLVAGLPGPRPCTPRGVMEMLARSGIAVAGLDALVIGRSRLVGLPLAVMLIQAGATVTVAHSRTRDLADRVRRAELVVSAVGQPGLVRRDWIQPGAIVIDVGITRGPEGLVGDVEAGIEGRARLWTPVPGGVGPMTVAMLLQNTLEAFQYEA